MTLYLILIAIANVIIITFNSIFTVPKFDTSIVFFIVTTILSTIAVILIDLVVCWFTHLFPKKWIAPSKKIFQVSKGEKKFYEHLYIKAWKEKIPELGVLCNFRKNKILEPNNNEYIEKFIYETIYGGLCHINSAIFGFLVIFILPLKFWCCVCLYVAIVNAILNLLPLFVLRYNRYKLNIVYKKNEKLASKKEKIA